MPTQQQIEEVLAGAGRREAVSRIAIQLGLPYFTVLGILFGERVLNPVYYLPVFDEEFTRAFAQAWERGMPEPRIARTCGCPRQLVPGIAAWLGLGYRRDDAVTEVRRRRGGGESAAALAKAFNVSRQTIYNWCDWSVK